jgi:hypothetical protein
VWKESSMNAQEPRIEDRATWGDVVGAIIAGAICLGAVALSLTVIDMRDRLSALTSMPMDARSSPPITARNPLRSQYLSTE